MWQDGSGKWHITDEEIDDIGKETSELITKISDNETLLNKIFEIANNAIYFRDNSDYLTALYQICKIIKPDDESIGEKLAFLVDE
jgi:hypothetical protein